MDKKSLVIIPTYNEAGNIERLLKELLAKDLDILIVDEALSTGDAKFKEKSLAKLKELRGDNRALILVSHALGTIREVCNDVAWLHKGNLIQRGNPGDVVDAYQDFLAVGKSAVINEDV